MRWNVYIIKSLCTGLLLSGLLFTGCSSGKLAKTETPVEETAPSASSAEAEISSLESDDLDLDALVQEAERHYAKGCEHYNAGDWALAEQEFDRALETLLDADVDAETHYRLGKAYNTLFYNIHKFALKQSYLSHMEQEPVQEEEERVSLEALPPDISVDVEPQPVDASSQYPTDTLGTVFIDQADADILKYIKQFSHEKSQYRRGLKRSGKYLPMIRQIFAEYKLPEELIYIPIIESNFRVDAVSPAGAVGMWQFVRTTAKVYGLKVDKWVDERRDPKKSTIAAAKYLRDLYDMLGDWDLAMSGYYMGEYKVHKAIGRYRTRDISTLADKKYFGSGAKQYVGRIKAAAFIAMNPDQHDLDVTPSSPLHYETIDVAKGKRLSDVARQLGVSSTQLKELNPELKTSIIPPGSGQYTLKVPIGSGQIMLAEQASPPKDSASKPSVSASVANSDDYLIHSVRRGETLARIARRYGVNALMLQSFNNIHNARTLQIGQKLKVPMTEIASLSRTEVITHIIQKGENLDRIAKRYKVSVATLQSYNNIRNVRRLQIGQAIKVPLPQSHVLAKTQEKRVLTYQVKRGDSLSKIASTFGVSVSQLKKWNNVQGTLIYPGSRIKVWY